MKSWNQQIDSLSYRFALKVDERHGSDQTVLIRKLSASRLAARSEVWRLIGYHVWKNFSKYVYTMYFKMDIDIYVFTIRTTNENFFEIINYFNITKYDPHFQNQNSLQENVFFIIWNIDFVTKWSRTVSFIPAKPCIPVSASMVLAHKLHICMCVCSCVCVCLFVCFKPRHMQIQYMMAKWMCNYNTRPYPDKSTPVRLNCHWMIGVIEQLECVSDMYIFVLQTEAFQHVDYICIYTHICTHIYLRICVYIRVWSEVDIVYWRYARPPLDHLSASMN